MSDAPRVLPDKSAHELQKSAMACPISDDITGGVSRLVAKIKRCGRWR
jgi:hypothetical protein